MKQAYFGGLPPTEVVVLFFLLFMCDRLHCDRFLFFAWFLEIRLKVDGRFTAEFGYRENWEIPNLDP